ncbi:MAG: DUF7144 family membrane protein [Gaiellaceae bacterium]
MRTTQDYDVGRRDYAAGSLAYEAEKKGAGWVAFAAILLGLSGLWNFFDGIAAISGAHVYVANANYVFSDLNTWGWIVLCLGALQGFAALSLLTGSEFGRWIGIVSASLNAIGQLMFAPAYPLWSFAMFSVDILIIYGLAVYGGARLRD